MPVVAKRLILLALACAFGVALLAGVGTGRYPSVQAACAQTIAVVERTAANAEHAAVYARYYPIFRRLYAQVQDEFRAVAQAQQPVTA